MLTKVTWLSDYKKWTQFMNKMILTVMIDETNQQQQIEASEPDENTEEQLCDRYTNIHQ